MIAARPSSGAGISQKTLAAERVWPSGARPAASLLISILRQPSPAKRVTRRDRRFFHLVFPARLSSPDPNPTRHGRMAAAPLLPQPLLHLPDRFKTDARQRSTSAMLMRRT
jgi:hypothetical protein